MSKNTYSRGDYDHRFFIDTAPETTTQGHVTLDWAAASSVRRWGKFLPKFDRQYIDGMQRFAEAQWVIQIEGRLSISSRNRIRTNETPARTLEILGPWGECGKSVETADPVYVAVREQPGVGIGNPRVEL